MEQQPRDVWQVIRGLEGEKFVAGLVVGQRANGVPTGIKHCDSRATDGIEETSDQANGSLGCRELYRDRAVEGWRSRQDGLRGLGAIFGNEGCWRCRRDRKRPCWVAQDTARHSRSRRTRTWV